MQDVVESTRQGHSLGKREPDDGDAQQGKSKIKRGNDVDAQQTEACSWLSNALDSHQQPIINKDDVIDEAGWQRLL